ncbi:MAG: DUF262 domain-containing protein, partial [Methanoregula sp.]
ALKARKYRLQIKEIKIKIILYNISKLISSLSFLIFIEEFYRARLTKIYYNQNLWIKKESNMTDDGIDVEDVNSEMEDYTSTLPNYRIFTYPADFTLEVLNNKLSNKKIIVPDFQRGFVWKKIQATRLIESFLVGLPVPAIFLYTEPESQNSLVIDGQQRLKSIHYFINGYFGDEKEGKREVFRLTELNPKSEYFGKSFADLTDADKEKFINRILRAFIVEQHDPKDATSIYHIFERLNTGGTSLTNQEIRNSIYHGSFNELMKKLNNDPHWRRIVGKPVVDGRQRDIEFILRFFAFYYEYDNYEKPLKEFMNTFMAKHQNASRDFIENSEKIFRDTCEKVDTILGPKPFHIVSGLNPGFFDSVMYNFAHNLSSINHDIKDKYQNLKQDTIFYGYCRNATTDVKIVQSRFSEAKKQLFT